MLRHPMYGHGMTSKWPQRPTPQPHAAEVPVNAPWCDQHSAQTARPRDDSGVLGAILWWESRRPLRRAVESKPRRISRSVVIVAVSAAAMQVAGRPVVGPLTALVERRQWGLLKWVSLPRWVEGPLALVLLDYTLYIWHVLTHRVSWLWRFHIVHHIDLDLDTSTALRFHCGELTVSVVWQAGQVVLLRCLP
jgi:sterol desaturase/sphingolipid hydroxylase (fatty acid hydroxylase superfamily)